MGTDISKTSLLQRTVALQGEKLHQDDLEDLLDVAAQDDGQVDDVEKMMIADVYVTHARAGKTTDRADSFYKELTKQAGFPSKQAVQDSWDSGS